MFHPCLRSWIPTGGTNMYITFQRLGYKMTLVLEVQTQFPSWQGPHEKPCRIPQAVFKHGQWKSSTNEDVHGKTENHLQYIIYKRQKFLSPVSTCSTGQVEVSLTKLPCFAWFKNVKFTMLVGQICILGWPNSDYCQFCFMFAHNQKKKAVCCCFKSSISVKFGVLLTCHMFAYPRALG